MAPEPASGSVATTRRCSNEFPVWAAPGGPEQTHNWNQKRKKRPEENESSSSISVVEPNAAAVDIGATDIYVAVPADRDPKPVRSFPSFTGDLERVADWLETCDIETV